MNVAENTVKLIASSIRISNIQTPELIRLSNETQQFIIDIVENAKAIALISKRSRIAAKDINESLESYSYETLLGYEHMKKPKITTIPFSKQDCLTIFADKRLEINDVANWKLLPYQLAPHFKIFPLIFNGTIIQTPNEEIPNELAEETQIAQPVESYTRLTAYFQKSISYLFEEESKFCTVIEHIAKDMYVGELFPRYIDYIEDFLISSQDDFTKCLRVLRFLIALCSNPEYQIIEKIDNIISFGLTFLTSNEDKRASSLIRCQLYQKAVILLSIVTNSVSRMLPDIKSSLAIELRSVMQLENAYALAGSIKLLSEMGQDIIRIEVLPRLKEIYLLCLNEKFTQEEKNIAMCEFQSVLAQIAFDQISNCYLTIASSSDFDSQGFLDDFLSVSNYSNYVFDEFI